MTDFSPGAPAGDRRDAPAARRNAQAILDVLARILPEGGTVLEIGSGTGQHAVMFAHVLAPRRWLPSDPAPRQRASIQAWITESAPPHPLTPRMIDASEPDWDLRADDHITAMFSANVIHISPWEVCRGILAGAGRHLPGGGLVCFYGPFSRGGTHTAPSNAAFDASLRAQNPAWGVRDLDDVTREAEANGLSLEPLVEMPSNNLIVSFRRVGS